jgi:polyphosphate kinase
MDKFNNRELSWLAFNRRVLQEAGDGSVPLLQRLRFLGIYSNNRDEFIKVRIANLMRMEKDRKGGRNILTGGYTPKELLEIINRESLESQRVFLATYAQILKEMAALHIRLLNERELSPEQALFCRTYFSSVVSPRIVPLFLHKSKSMGIPFLPDTNGYLAVCMDSGRSGNRRFAILQLPVSGGCPRFVRMPSAPGRDDLIFLEDIIRLCLDDIFFMFKYKTIQAFAFKIVRDAALTLDMDISKSLLARMGEGLGKRLRGSPVRLIYDREMPEDLLHTIAAKLKLRHGDLDAGARHHMMRDLIKFPGIRPELENIPRKPLPHPDIKPLSSILKAVSRKDILLAFPYRSFHYVIDFLREAAIDPRVDSIHISLYRTAEDSQIVNALIRAAQNGKKVEVLIELMARFDERNNAGTVDMLQNAGVRVIHGPPDLKVHCKLLLVQRMEGSGKPRGYTYIGTGNFNEDTALTYSDLGLLTADPLFAADVRAIFDFMSATHRHFTCKQLLVAPYDMRKAVTMRIKKEIHAAKKGREAFIWLKCNNLTDKNIIGALYEAGEAGVDVRVIVRGACCLRAKPMEENRGIRAVSIVDGYLEHARIMIFGNGGDNAVYISSADLMTRNLDRRLETAAPILSEKLRRDVKRFFLIQWSDNVKARDLGREANSYVKPAPGAPLVRSQAAIHDLYAGARAAG